jgi:hypothetical protein
MSHELELVSGARVDGASNLPAACCPSSAVVPSAEVGAGLPAPDADPQLEPPVPVPSLFEPDPDLHSRLRPNASVTARVRERTVVMENDASGCRRVVGQPTQGEKTLAVYGCSFVYGMSMPAAETFCSLLQQLRPAWRIENHGVPGYSGSRNVIQLELQARRPRPDFVTLCWIPDHMGRNVATIPAVQTMSANIAKHFRGGPAPIRPFPRAAIDTDGALYMRSVLVPRPDLIDIDCLDFVPDAFYLELVCLRLLERANAIVSARGGRFFITTLKGKLPRSVAERLAAQEIPVVDASVEGRQFQCAPDDPNPNALAHGIYAQRIDAYLTAATH